MHAVCIGIFYFATHSAFQTYFIKMVDDRKKSKQVVTFFPNHIIHLVFATIGLNTLFN